MNNGVVLFLGILVSLAASFWTLIFAPQLQLGRQDTRVIDASGAAYPSPRRGFAQRGADVFRAQGCAECHTRQVRQTGVEFDLYLAEPPTNKAAFAVVLNRFDSKFALADIDTLLARLPAKIAEHLSVSAATKAASVLSTDGAVVAPVLVPLGPDIARGWGKRLSVAQDYLQDNPVQLGGLRLGPDLANYGARQTNLNALLEHLFDAPQAVKGSMMPPYRYLFEKRPLSAGEAKPADAAFVLGESANRQAIIPTDDARALADYLLSLRAEVDLFEAPAPKMPTAPAPATNAPAVASAK